MRLIDADLLLEKLKGCLLKNEYTESDEVRNAFVMNCIEEVELAPTVDEWISCKDRLPNMTESQKNRSRIGEPVEFNVMIKGADNPTTLEYTADGFWIDESFSTYIVVAWQPLPQPYKEK